MHIAAVTVRQLGEFLGYFLPFVVKEHNRCLPLAYLFLRERPNHWPGIRLAQ
ncbi:hypothetical protein AGRO_1625 [Agrobacterium sp. ATCC 31749]|nr:hypothetical protein AGRO_1625 [Agrobacterium sp. ATCC 31749]